MTQEALIYVMAAAVTIGALALVLQAVLLLGLHRSAKATKDQVTLIAERAEPLFESAQRVIEQSRQQITEVTSKASALLDTTQGELAQLDAVLSEATGRARIQMDRLELVMDDTISRVQETTSLIHDGIVRPIREVSGLIVGIRTAYSCLVKGRRPTVEQATHDDEMFI